MPACLLSHLTAVKTPLGIFISAVLSPRCTLRALSHHCSSLPSQKTITQARARACARWRVHTLQLVARLQLDAGALGFCQPQGKLAECSAEGDQRGAVLLTWQPSHHTEGAMCTDSTEICAILRTLRALFISVHIMKTKAGYQ